MINKEGNFDELNKIINDIYNSLIDCQNYDEIVNGMANYMGDLINYIDCGMNMQLYEIMNHPNGNYENYNIVMSRLSEIIPRTNMKKM